jgi:hypothetical protein
VPRPVQNRIDWLKNDLMCWQPYADGDLLNLLTGIEDVTALNPSSRPIRYLFDFSDADLHLTLDDAHELAKFLLAFTASPTVIALVQSDPKDLLESETVFVQTLREGGYEIETFQTLSHAEAWLTRRLTSCTREGLTCSAGCPLALSEQCPALSRAKLN